MSEMATFMLWLRFLFGYPFWVGWGLILASVAFGRMRSVHNGRRKLYRALAMVAFSLVWCGFAGTLGIMQYGTLLPALALPREAVSVMFSAGVVSLGLSLMVLSWHVLRQEWVRAKTLTRAVE